MIRLRPTHLILSAMTVAIAGKMGTLGLGGQDQMAAPLPALDTFNIVAPALAAGGQDDAPQTLEEHEAEKVQVCKPAESVFAEIANERKLLREQQDSLLEREAKIALGVERLELESAQLGALKSALEELIAKVEAAQNADVTRLVNLYRNMKPKSAAGILNELDIESSVIVLGTMAERDAAPILANLDPNRARAISKIILERSKLPGDQDFSGIRLR